MKTGHNKLYIAFSAWADIPVGDNMLITEAGTELGAGGGGDSKTCVIAKVSTAY